MTSHDGGRLAAAGCVRHACTTILLACLISSMAWGQSRPNHYFHSADMPPGSIGQAQLLRGGPLPGHVQAVQIQAPPGAQLAMAIDQGYDAPRPAPLNVGLLIGQVYTLKVSNIPDLEGYEVFPTIEVINRLYPPEGKQARFPIPIQLTREELLMALEGKFVTRVVYLEDPRVALPVAQDPQLQRYFEVGPNQDPLRVADDLGRPMAILRMGSRIPDVGNNLPYVYLPPPWIPLPTEDEDAAGDQARTTTDAIERYGRDVPRVRADQPHSNTAQQPYQTRTIR